jgi:hypothetical protein
MEEAMTASGIRIALDAAAERLCLALATSLRAVQHRLLRQNGVRTAWTVTGSTVNAPSQFLRLLREQRGRTTTLDTIVPSGSI